MISCKSSYSVDMNLRTHIDIRSRRQKSYFRRRCTSTKVIRIGIHKSDTQGIKAFIRPHTRRTTGKCPSADRENQGIPSQVGCVHWDRNVSNIQWTEESRYWVARQHHLMEGSTRKFKNFRDAEHERTRRCIPQKG